MSKSPLWDDIGPADPLSRMMLYQDNNKNSISRKSLVIHISSFLIKIFFGSSIHLLVWWPASYYSTTSSQSSQSMTHQSSHPPLTIPSLYIPKIALPKSTTKLSCVVNTPHTLAQPSLEHLTAGRKKKKRPCNLLLAKRPSDRHPRSWSPDAATAFIA